MDAPKYLNLYSVNTWLAYAIAQRFYNGLHYVWCSPHFSSDVLPAYDNTTPPTSTPAKIYKSLYEEVRAGDRHSTKIKENKIGILNGAIEKEKAGIINAEQKTDIIDIVNSAEVSHFRPLLYVIPFSLISDILREIQVVERAHPLSVEYRIDSLPRQYFDIITFD